MCTWAQNDERRPSDILLEKKVHWWISYFNFLPLIRKHTHLIQPATLISRDAKMIYSLFHWRFYFNHWSFSVYFKTDLEDLWFSHTYRCMPSLEISVAGCIRWVSFRINGRKLKYDIHQWTFFSRRMSDGIASETDYRSFLRKAFFVFRSIID
jgi:hypothetical protein